MLFDSMVFANCLLDEDNCQRLLLMYIVKNDDVTNATQCWLWFNTEEISCEEWVMMAISNGLMVEVSLTDVIMHA